MKKILKIIAATLISVVIAIALVYTHKKQEAEKLESIRMSEIRESINESIQESREIEINNRVAELKKEIKQKIENNKLEGKTISLANRKYGEDYTIWYDDFPIEEWFSIEFGSIKTSRKSEKKPIQWIIMDDDGHKVKLLSKYVLRYGKINDFASYSDEIFDEIEKKVIDGGKTQLLSKEDINQYLNFNNENKKQYREFGKEEILFMLDPGKAIRTYDFSSIEPGAHGFDDTVEFGSLYSAYFISDMWEPNSDDLLSFEEYIKKPRGRGNWDFEYENIKNNTSLSAKEKAEEISALKENYYNIQRKINDTVVNLEVSGHIIQRPNDSDILSSGWRPVISITYDE